MPKFLAIFLAVLLPGASIAAGVRYTVTGTYPSDVPASYYVTPGAPFTFTALFPGEVPNHAPTNVPFSIGVEALSTSYQTGNLTTPATGGYSYCDNCGDLSTLSFDVGGSVIDFGNRLGLMLAGRPDAQGLSHLSLGPNFGAFGAAGPVPVTLTVPNGNGGFAYSSTTITVTALAVQGVVVDVTGYFIPSAPKSILSAPDQAFLMEFSVPTVLGPSATVPQGYATGLQYGSYTFNGETTPGAATNRCWPNGTCKAGSRSP